MVENPELSFGDIGRAIGRRWQALPEEEKASYAAMASADKERYCNEVRRGEAK